MPTPNQEAVVKEIIENVGKGKKISLSAIQKKHGYSKSYAESGRIASTRGWETLLEQYFPDEDMTEVIRELMHNIDWHARDAGVDKALRLKSKYPATKIEVNQLSVDTRTDKEIAAEIEELRKDVHE